MAPRYLRNTGNLWTPAEDRQLRRLAAENTPTRVIGLKLGRSALAVQSRATQLSISLAPTNQAPYDRRVTARRRLG
jgi:hypothetical protein